MQITIKTYEGLQETIDHFIKGIYEILIIHGDPGTGKSQAIKQAFSHLTEQEYLWLEGRTTAPMFYQKLYEYIDCPIVLDDSDAFMSDKQCINLLKTLCQTDKDKRVQWLTLRNLPEGMPTSFNTSSTVVLITNEWRTMSKHLSAVQDRGLYVRFIPSVEEIHQYAKKLCHCEIWQFFDLFLHTIQDLSLRQYVIAQNMYKEKIAWRRYVIQNWGLDDTKLLYLEIEIEYADKSEYERKILFIKMSGKNTKTYERVKRELMNR